MVTAQRQCEGHSGTVRHSLQSEGVIRVRPRFPWALASSELAPSRSEVLR